MLYVYPKLSKYDLIFLRMGGPGLGNLLFPYAEAISLAKKFDLQIIWPTWSQFKIGPFIRREKDKRIYFNLFSITNDYIKKVEKLRLILMSKKIGKEEFLRDIERFINNQESSKIVVICSGMETLFTGFIKEHQLIKNELENICRIKNEYGNMEYVGVHIRFGDFKEVSNGDLAKCKSNSRIPLEWFIEKIEQVQNLLGKDIEVHIFSDASDYELKDILSLSGVKRVTYGTSINDILALSRARILIASNSTFSMWASYLGRMPVIWYKDQIKQRLYYEEDAVKEIDLGMGEELPHIFAHVILEMKHV